MHQKTLRFLIRLRRILPRGHKKKIQDIRIKKARIFRAKKKRLLLTTIPQPATPAKWDVTMSISAPFPGFEYSLKMSFTEINDKNIETLVEKLYMQLKNTQTNRELRSTVKAYSSIANMVSNIFSCKVVCVTSHIQDMILSEQVFKKATEKLKDEFNVYSEPLIQKTLLQKVTGFFK